MTLRWALPGLIFLLLPSCHSLKVGRNAPTEEANPYELAGNAGYSQGGFYGDPAGAGAGTTAGAYPAEGQTFGGYGSTQHSGTSSAAAPSDRAQVAPFDEGAYSRSASAGSTATPEPKPVASTSPPSVHKPVASASPPIVHKPVTSAAKKKPSSPTHAVASTTKQKSPALASSRASKERHAESRTTAGTKGGTALDAVYHPPGSSTISTSKTAAAHRVHTVAPGDTLSKLASRYDVSVAAVKKQNHLPSDLIRVGQRLTID